MIFMNQRIFPSIKRFAVVITFLFCLIAIPTLAQNAKSAMQRTPPATDEKAAQILQRAIEAMGGSAYLNVRTIVGHGQFTQFKDGESGLPSAFVDYIVFPDRERTDFHASSGKIIQTNTGDTGWVYDGAAKSIKEMTKAQVEDFKLSLRASVENLLRGFWRKDGAKLAYVGRREAGIGQRNEVVRLTYPDGYAVEFEFAAKDSLPMKILYKRKNAEGQEIAEEDRLAQHLKIQGVTTPFVIDHYSAGAQTSRINYQSMELNTAIPDSLFARPASVKDIKK
jgi:outer membrane lipoprotein-sorting protein